ncbi:hypothetical protein COY07_00685 [Candidatus Peregrinibacteria bacterium CG_4_10_14_0_2_um_filter_43_11]|nr:MAG: hypothetical protein COY07_00685 [Candidatus Peregrinibacteria bacterium CG_4_10_14_0_2_um_filter_43_11]
MSSSHTLCSDDLPTGEVMPIPDPKTQRPRGRLRTTVARLLEPLANYLRPQDEVAGLREQLEVALREKDQMATRVDVLELVMQATRHDLNNLLAVIGGNAELIMISPSGDNGEKAQRIGRSSEIIQELLTALSDFISGKPFHDPVDINQIINKTMEVFFDHRDAIQINVAAGTTAIGHEGLLLHVFENLIANAIHYAETQRPIAIQITATDSEEDGFLQVTMTDNGVGVTEDERDAIFKKGVRGNNHNRAGSGLGLAICKMIVEHHGGRTWVESAPGEGARFCFTLKKMTVTDASDS